MEIIANDPNRNSQRLMHSPALVPEHQVDPSTGVGHNLDPNLLQLPTLRRPGDPNSFFMGNLYSVCGYDYCSVISPSRYLAGGRPDVQEQPGNSSARIGNQSPRHFLSPWQSNQVQSSSTSSPYLCHSTSPFARSPRHVGYPQAISPCFNNIVPSPLGTPPALSIPNSSLRNENTDATLCERSPVAPSSLESKIDPDKESHKRKHESTMFQHISGQTSSTPLNSIASNTSGPEYSIPVSLVSMARPLYVMTHPCYNASAPCWLESHTNQDSTSYPHSPLYGIHGIGPPTRSVGGMPTSQTMGSGASAYTGDRPEMPHFLPHTPMVYTGDISPNGLRYPIQSSWKQTYLSKPSQYHSPRNIPPGESRSPSVSPKHSVPASPTPMFLKSSDEDERIQPKRARIKVGNYKRRRLLKLLNTESAHIVVTSFVAWPEMDKVYFCQDYAKLSIPPGAKNDEHAFRKYANFSHGSYTQSQTRFRDKTYNIRQSRCAGFRTCNVCNAVSTKNRRKTHCVRHNCFGTISHTECHVTLYYLFPADPARPTKADANHRERFLVCLADEGYSGHSHSQNLVSNSDDLKTSFSTCLTKSGTPSLSPWFHISVVPPDGTSLSVGSNDNKLCPAVEDNDNKLCQAVEDNEPCQATADHQTVEHIQQHPTPVS